VAYYRKNKRRFDPRYFLSERMEKDVSEIVVPGPSAKFDVERPETVRQRLEKSFEKKALEDEEEALHHLSAAEEEEEERRRIRSLEEGCGDVEELPWVEIDGGKLTASDDSEQSLADIVRTGNAWKDMGIEIIGGREDVLSALGVEITASEPLPQLMDEEPPLEE
jgi:hypothetical protein